jgi:hypothetical protein
LSRGARDDNTTLQAFGGPNPSLTTPAPKSHSSGRAQPRCPTAHACTPSPEPAVPMAGQGGSSTRPRTFADGSRERALARSGHASDHDPRGNWSQRTATISACSPSISAQGICHLPPVATTGSTKAPSEVVTSGCNWRLLGARAGSRRTRPCHFGADGCGRLRLAAFASIVDALGL